MDLTLITTLIILIFILLITHFPSNPLMINATSSNHKCSINKCGNDPGSSDIRFPFKLSGSDQPNSCGYDGFYLTCDGNTKKSIIELKNSGNFTVTSIDYVGQEIWLNDPNNCLPKRLLSLNFSGSPFLGIYYQDFTFLNCSSLITNNSNNSPFINQLIGPILCLSGSNFFFYAIPSSSIGNITITNSTSSTNTRAITWPLPECSIKRVRVPIQWPLLLKNRTGSSLMSNLEDDLRLSYYMPGCRKCELNGQMCELKTNSNGSILRDTICTEIINQGKKRLSVTTFISIILIVCAPSLICIVGSLVFWARPRWWARPNPSIQQPTTITPRPIRIFGLGLEAANIEFARRVVEMGLEDEPDPNYHPKIDTSEIEEMGPTRDKRCPICLGEYRKDDKVGILPRCGHYFHVDCINQWLRSCSRIHKTCPICRVRLDPSS